MKKILFIFFLAVVFLFPAHAQQWVNFSSSQPNAPEHHLLNSNAQSVSFSVTVPGIYTLDTVVNGTAFTRLGLPKGATINPVGHPEIHALKYQIAIPNCDDIEVAYRIDSRQTLAPCWVYPVPEMVLDANGNSTEQFAFEPDAYTQPRNIEPAVIISSSGALRAQRYVEIMVQPIEFCPFTRQLSVIDQIEITLTFTNPQGDLRQNVGIFNKVAAKSFINYECDGMSAMINDKAFLKEGATPGQVKWITLTNPAQADTIVADYLIICAGQFIPPSPRPQTPHPQVIRLAEHRAYYNGFDVAIVNVEHILSLPFEYEGYPNTEYIKEQKLRTFIRRVYEGANAQNTGDGKLWYVLLIGDNFENNTGMPVSSDHNAFCDHHGKYPSDYYFSCVTKTGSSYDEIGDLFIGRFSVENTTQLYNMVQKTIYHETEYNPKSWQKMAGTTVASFMNRIRYLNFFTDLMNNCGWDYSMVYCPTNNCSVQVPTMNYFNAGASFIQYVGGPDMLLPPSSWMDGLNIGYFLNELNNDNKSPLINATGSNSAHFDNMECLGEFLTRYHPSKGAVGYIGPARRVGLQVEPWPPGSDYMLYQELLPHLLFIDSTYVAGELLLTTKIMDEDNNSASKRNRRHAYTFFGDPALNSLAVGYEVTGELDCPIEISTPLWVRNGETMVIPDSCTVLFFDNGRLTVEEGGTLVIGNHAQVSCLYQYSSRDSVIHVKGGEFILGNNVSFNNLNTGAGTGIVLENNRNQLYDRNKVYNIKNATFNSSQLFHRGTKLNVTNCTFNHNFGRISGLYTFISESKIDSCTFNSADFCSDNSFIRDISHPASWKFSTSVTNSTFQSNLHGNIAIGIRNNEEFYISNNTISNYKYGIEISKSGLSLSSFSQNRTENLIEKNVISNCFYGICLFTSGAHFRSNQILNNGQGVRLQHNSYSIFDNSYLPEQRIKNCNYNELYACATSFPTIFRNNIIWDDDKQGVPLFYWDAILFGSLRPKDISYNCWGDNFDPLEDLHPYQELDWNPVNQCAGKSGTPTQGDDEIETLYKIGLIYFAEEDYTNAELTFKEIIETYPESHFAIAALHELFALEHYTNQDFFSLNTYFASFTDEDSVIFNTADFLATRCYVKEREWQPAVDWYEDRIMNPPSYQDSIFAVIDLGYIHLLMEADTADTRSGNVRYRLEEIKPKTKQHYEENKATLLATLPQIKKPQPEKPEIDKPEQEKINPSLPHSFNPSLPQKGTLISSTPNPTTGATTISYELYTEGNVEIFVYNSVGQLVLQIPKGTQAEGAYQATVALTNMPKGVYHYALYINGERTDTKKLVLTY